MSSHSRRATVPGALPRLPDTDEAAARERILEAAFAAFVEHGYAATSTLEIATRARVSKRELYALVGKKQDMLLACIQARAGRLRVPTGEPSPGDREALQHLLASFGAQLLREVSDPTVVAVFRLAVAEAANAPEVARMLDATGREAARVALREVMAQARASGLIEGRPDALAEQFRGLLWGDLMVGLLLGVTARPTSGEVKARARAAVLAFMQLHVPPEG